MLQKLMVCLVLGVALAAPQTVAAQTNDEWTRPFPP